MSLYKFSPAELARALAAVNTGKHYRRWTPTVGSQLDQNGSRVTKDVPPRVPMLPPKLSRPTPSTRKQAER